MAGEGSTWLNRLPAILKNKFFLVGLAYVLYLFFLDGSDIPGQIKLKRELMKLNNQKAYYTNEIEKVKEERKELFSSWENLEKFGREKYHMKRDACHDAHHRKRVDTMGGEKYLTNDRRQRSSALGLSST